MTSYHERTRAARARMVEEQQERRRTRMEHAYGIGKQWEEAAAAYYGHSMVDIEFSAHTGLYRTIVGSGEWSGWVRESTIQHATQHMWAELHERELTAGIDND